MQIERLVQMVFYIIHREHVTAKKLAEHFDVSTRTIYRDINTLSLAGIPVASSKGAGGGISIMDGYTIHKTLLSQEEQQNIYQGLQILQASKYPNAQAALDKIGSVFKNALQPHWLEVDFSHWGSDEKHKTSIADLQYAILNKHRITFDYFNSELQKSNRTVEPLRLLFKSHAWYIVGHCCHRRETRTFRLSRMRDIHVTPDVFERELPQDHAPAPKEKPESDIPTITLKFAPEAAHKLYDEFHESQVAACPDGGYIVTARYELNNWTFSRLLSYGKHVEVLAPKTLRAMLKEKALEIAAIYASD